MLLERRMCSKRCCAYEGGVSVELGDNYQKKDRLDATIRSEALSRWFVAP